MATEKQWRTLQLGTYAGYMVFAWLDNGGVNIDMDDLICPSDEEVAHTVHLPDRAMDQLARAWLRHREGDAFGEVFDEDGEAALKDRLTKELHQAMEQLEGPDAPPAAADWLRDQHHLHAHRMPISKADGESSPE